MAPLAIPLMVMGTAVSAYSAYRQGREAKKESEAASQQARAEAEYHKLNAKIAAKEAESERQAAIVESIQHRRQAEQLMSRQRALIGASGVTPEGSPLLIAEDTAAQLTLENAFIRETGKRRAETYRSQSLLDLRKSVMAEERAVNYLEAGESAAETGTLSAGGSLLTGFGQTAFMKSQMK